MFSFTLLLLLATSSWSSSFAAPTAAPASDVLVKAEDVADALTAIKHQQQQSKDGDTLSISPLTYRQLLSQAKQLSKPVVDNGSQKPVVVGSGTGSKPKPKPAVLRIWKPSKSDAAPKLVLQEVEEPVPQSVPPVPGPDVPVSAPLTGEDKVIKLLAQGDEATWLWRYLIGCSQELVRTGDAGSLDEGILMMLHPDWTKEAIQQVAAILNAEIGPVPEIPHSSNAETDAKQKQQKLN